MSLDQDGLPSLRRAAESTDEPTANSRQLAAALASDVKKGSLWTGASTLLLRLSNIALMAVVARIVAPDELGVFALAVTVQAVLLSVAELGVASAIARTDLDVDAIAPTVVSISVITSLFLAGLMALFAGDIAGVLGSPAAEQPIRILALSVALIGPFAVPGAQLQSSFRQDLVFRANMVSFFPASAVLILIALGGDGAAAFAWSRVVGQLVAGSLMLLSVPKRYSFGLNKAYLGPLIGFGVPLALANLLSQALLNVDYVFVGRLMSTADVGLYMLAFNVCMWSTAVIGSILNGIVLPAFSSVQRDGGDMRTALSSAVRTVAFIACPIAAFTCTFATPLVTAIYGSQWVDAGPVLRVLSFYGVVFVLGLLFANVIISTGRTWVLFSVQFVALVSLIPALTVGIHFAGLVGIGIAHIAVISVVTLPAYLWAVSRTTGARIGFILLAMGRPAIASIAAGIIAALVTWPLSIDLVKLCVGGVAGAVVYAFLTRHMLVPMLPESWRERFPGSARCMLGRADAGAPTRRDA
ncbi:Teichuronic acid biosynthesis protein TuaB [Arthrobacter sp. SO5]|uniref:oligosaccharide flippase family protein n=1 Tax=Arthrobacter sp. SO5 TaxID=1897055 RepID=UPI001E334BA4|nr:oligosaccharide flippase family protein [Arthrobacter sp. SO5]MCB5273173.1 Teichuronic acid biosynthesis protein TuaB [Arthrobacter sp. SO5]